MGHSEFGSQSLGRPAVAGLLSNGAFRSWINARARGALAYRDLQLSTWEGDRVGDRDGLRLYVRDRQSRRWWSLGEPSVDGSPGADAAGPELRTEPGRLTFRQSHDGLRVELELWIDPDRPVELRRLRVRNERSAARHLELTTFVEIVLHDALAHLSHPLFSKLFLQTEWVDAEGSRAAALLARRRPRGLGESWPWIFHAVLDAPVIGSESDRARFLGREHAPDAPRALRESEPLSGSDGNVLDPALSLRIHLDLAPHEERTVSVLFGVASSRDLALSTVEALGNLGTQERSRNGAAAQEDLRRSELGLDDLAAARLQALAVAMLYGDRSLRADANLLRRTHGEPSDLRLLGVSASVPFAMLDLEQAGLPAGTLSSTLQAHRYWRMLGLPFELCVVSGRAEDVSSVRALDGQVGGVHAFESGELGPTDRERLQALAAWVVREPADQTFPGMMVRVENLGGESSGILDSSGDTAGYATPEGASSADALRFANRHGGFREDGAEYVVRMDRRSDGSWSRPPRPWVNVLANERFGSLISESGAGTTWSVNSRQRRLSPWLNDSVLDPHGDAFYLQDERDGRFWSPLPGPAPAAGPYAMRHGFGYSRCEHRSEGLEEQCTIFVPKEDPLRLAHLRVRNLGRTRRRLSFYSYTQLVLGDRAAGSGRCIVTEFDARRRTLLARNRLSGTAEEAIVFATVRSDAARLQWQGSADREQFLGRGGKLSMPRLLVSGASLTPRFGAADEPCFTLQVHIALDPGEERHICVLLGEAKDGAELDRLLRRYDGVSAVHAALHDVQRFWAERVDALCISTPSVALDLLVNGWLIYQTVACRLWARSAFYQSGGAFGFRDQLQDAVALVAFWPELARHQILLHAAHQFVEGDVLHWWHPESSCGLRTRFVDDLLWLPHLCAHYLRCTGDVGILEEEISFLTAPSLNPGEDERYLRPEPSEHSGSLFEHCCRAIDRSLEVGAHGLPLFGAGDWNDGMNRVGREGRGESVWMAFFLHTILGEWIRLCAQRNEAERASRYAQHRERLAAAANEAGWDGQWYRRGYYDDGSPLGSKQSEECRIDALAQAWSVISGVAPPKRARQAMSAVAEHLISEEDGLIRLLKPPFVDTKQDPGYIKGYVAGVRENGGQYTHAALWVVRAFAELGERERAARLLELISPAHHARDDAQVDVYQVEPYVVAADIYGVTPHVGRGGWTWYTGSAGWMLRVVHETVLGIVVEDGRWLLVRPRIPDSWPGFRARLRPLGRSTIYEIEISNPEGCAEAVVQVRLDGRELRPIDGRARVEIEFDAGHHRVELGLGAADRGR